MAESRPDQIARLLQEGLNHYGEDRVGPAILAWREVLTLAPENPEALDYIQTADRRTSPRPEDGDRSVSALQAVVAEAREMGARKEYESALELLLGAADSNLINLELDASIELVRSRLLKQYRESVGDLESVPVLGKDPMELTEFNLPPDVGFILSMVDGATSVTDLISLSGMDVFDVLRTVKGLIDKEIVRMCE
jgi:hypothetical protein